MKKKLKSLTGILLAFALALSIGPGIPAHAQAEVKVLESRAVVEYPGHILFMLELESREQAADIRLNYRVERDSFADVVCEASADFASNTASASWMWDMATTGNLPPGTVVEYWWKITTDNGCSLLTQVQQVVFDDHRHQWQKITEGNLSLFWYRGGQAFASELMETAQVSLFQMEEDMGAHLIRPVEIYIYGSSTDLQGAMLYVQEWAGGLAFTGYGVVAIGISPTDLDWGKRALVHELAHLVTHQMTNNPYNSIPVWLNEGVSMYAEGEMEEYSESSLKRAVLNDDLISVQSLASPFSTNADITYLSYAQSYSLVEYLVGEYGPQKMAGLLDVFRQGSTYDEAFLEVYGFDVDALDRAWQDYLMQKYGVYSAQTMAMLPPYLAILFAGFLILASVRSSFRKRMLA